MNANILTTTVKTTAALTLAFGSALGLGLTTNAQAQSAAKLAASEDAAKVPAGAVGRWIATSVSATTYSDRNSGRYLGGGSQFGQIYDFDAQGNFTYYLTIEIRTNNYVSRVRNNYKGTVTFTGSTFTFHPTSGHYHSEIGSRLTDRDMTAEDLAKIAKPLNWRLDKGADGKPRFIVPFNDGSKAEFRPLPDTDNKKK